MRSPRRQVALATAAVSLAALALAACGSDGKTGERAAQASTPPSAAASASLRPGPAGPRTTVQVTVPAGLGAAPFDKPRQLELPAGWTASVYARVDHPRFMAPTPSGEILVSQPGRGT